ncbi:MAG: DUF3298 domain-containing protein [Acinetobacter sp.]|jgi:hypothetical protein|nr:MAG: DUF3298 domain-containing protein [Acinetobacter sp.]
MNIPAATTIQHSAMLMMLSASICFGLTGCEKKPVAKAVEEGQSSAPIVIEPKQQTLEAKIEKVTVMLPECRGQSCPQIDIQLLSSNYPQLDQAVEQYILNYTKSLVQGFEIEPQAEQDHPQTQAKDSASPIVEMSGQHAEQLKKSTQQNELQRYINQFVQLAEEVKSLGSSAQLSLYIKPQVLNATGDVATVVINANNYVGGAHGSSAQQYLNFDLSDQTILNLDAVIQNGQRKTFNDLAYAAFEQWIKETQPNEDIQRYQELWKFTLSDNFYLSPNGLILQYGEYEIGPYVVGLPRLVIPYDKLQGILKPQYLPAIAQPKDTTHTPPASADKVA